MFEGDVRRLPDLLVRFGVLSKAFGLRDLNFFIGFGRLRCGVCLVSLRLPIIVPRIWNGGLFAHVVLVSEDCGLKTDVQFAGMGFTRRQEMSQKLGSTPGIIEEQEAT